MNRVLIVSTGHMNRFFVDLHMAHDFIQCVLLGCMSLAFVLV